MNRNIKLKWWQKGLLTAAISALGGLSSIKKSGKDEREFYEKDLKQAPWAAPGWAFGPIWSINNFFLIDALQRILKMENSDDKKKLLYLQAGIWTIFFSFGYVYFTKKSPVLAAVWTIGDAALAIASYNAARKVDQSLARQYVPLLSWTTYASTVAAYQALKNNDPVLETEAAA